MDRYIMSESRKDRILGTVGLSQKRIRRAHFPIALSINDVHVRLEVNEGTNHW